MGELHAAGLVEGVEDGQGRQVALRDPVDPGDRRVGEDRPTVQVHDPDPVRRRLDDVAVQPLKIHDPPSRRT